MTKKKSLIITVLLYMITIIFGLTLFHILRDNFELLIVTLIADLAMTTIIFIASIRYNNSSLYDPYWSVIPIF
ncbi:MAG: hypothetical protein JXR62_02315, partial [Bacilli bacterium]|nr:hypothetical protein [Bacilli bacterium]